jgi:hypothetical protein
MCFLYAGRGMLGTIAKHSILPALVLVHCVSCSTRAETQQPKSVDRGSAVDPAHGPVIITDSTQHRHDDELLVAVGNIWVESYVGKNRQKRRGPTAGLWLFFRSSKALNKHFRVHAAQTFEWGGYRFRIHSVSEKTVTLYIQRTAAASDTQRHHQREPRDLPVGRRTSEYAT